jgi:formamidopyrimidine-DNA glycosylase
MEGPEVKLNSLFLQKKLEGCIVNFRLDNEIDDYEPYIIDEITSIGKCLIIIASSEHENLYLTIDVKNTSYWSEAEPDDFRWMIKPYESPNLYFIEEKKSSTLTVYRSEAEFLEYRNTLGVDILSPEFTKVVWDKLVKKHEKSNICSFLVSQKYISGCGNYIKAEALYEAKISPIKLIINMTSKELEDLYIALILVSRKSFNAQALNQPFEYKIYNKSSAVKTKTEDGKITFWDPKVQK